AGPRQIDRMLGGVDEEAAGAEPARDALNEAVIVRNVMDGERAHDEIETARPERRLLDGHAQVPEARMAPLGSGQSEHPLRDVDRDHLRGSAFGEVIRELAGAAAEVEDAAARDVGEQRHEARMLERFRPARAKPLQLRIAREELGIVVGVLRRLLRGHAPSYRSWCRTQAIVYASASSSRPLGARSR